MVDPITPVSATSSSSATRAGSSVSIGSEPDNAWVAARQSHITTDLLSLKAASQHQHEGEHGQHDRGEEPHVSPDDRHPHRQQMGQTAGAPETVEDHPRLSGESERIGTQNFDENTPPGHRVAIL